MLAVLAPVTWQILTCAALALVLTDPNDRQPLMAAVAELPVLKLTLGWCT